MQKEHSLPLKMSIFLKINKNNFKIYNKNVFFVLKYKICKNRKKIKRKCD